MMLQSLPNKWVKNVVKLCGLATWCLITGLFVGMRPVQAADAVVGTGTAASCNEGAFDSALATVQNSGGGTITFSCGPGIQIINFFAGSTGKIINTPVVINAPDKLAAFNGEIVLNAYNERRHFYVEANGSLTLKNITLVQGFNNTGGGGSIYNLGTLILESATILDSNVDVNRSGGAILSSGGPVTITNSRLENNTGGSVGGLYLVGESADATITNSIFRNNRTTNTTYGLGGAITTWNGADVTIRTSTLEGNQARQGGAIYNQFAATTITIDANSKVITNTATLTGGAISNVLGTITISNSTLAGNAAQAGDGGGINNSGTLSISNSTLFSNSVSANHNGGAISSSGGPVTLTDSRLEDNSAGNGGGLHLGGNTNATITNSVFRNNRTTGEQLTGDFANGGAISAWYGAGVTIRSSTLQSNQAGWGGAIHSQSVGTTLTIEADTQLVSNTATIGGGGIYNEGGSSLTVINSTLSGNAAQVGGGGISNDGTSSVSNSTLSSNSSGQFGGGINNPGGTLTISNSTLSGNSAQGDGGGISNEGTLSISSSTLVSNSAAADHNGGAIWSAGPVAITDSRLEDNSAGNGGGLHLIGGNTNATITNSIFRNNRTTGEQSTGAFANGGAIAIWSGAAVTIRRSTLQGNQARRGGAIDSQSVGTTLTIEADTQLISNTATLAGGGIHNAVGSSLTISNSTLSGNSAQSGGGGIYNSSSLTISNSTLSGNSAQGNGGGISNEGTSSVSNSTLSGNSAREGGGGIYNGEDTSLSIVSTTLSGNSAVNDGGGMYHGGFPLFISNSIIANSSSGGDCRRATITSGHNLIEDNSCGFSGGTDPMLGPLQDNGGPTLTHALLPGSPAINTGSSSLTTDQRGVARPQGSAADIGAFELVYVNSAPVANLQTVTTPVGIAKVITLTASDADNDVLTYTITTSPISGTLSGTAPNITYTPNAGFRGSDSFAFRAQDGKLASNAAAVTITIEGQSGTNHPPMAVADAVTTTTGVTATISVLANDADPDGDALTVTINQQPQHGSAVVNGGDIVYTPSANFSGVDSLSYTVTDSKGATASAIITITVKAQASGATLYLPLISKP